jgi:hypothetical protein
MLRAEVIQESIQYEELIITASKGGEKGETVSEVGRRESGRGGFKEEQQRETSTESGIAIGMFGVRRGKEQGEKFSVFR